MNPYVKLKIEQFKIACVAANNSTFKIQNSKFLLAVAGSGFAPQA